MRNLTMVVFTKLGNLRDDSGKRECLYNSLSLYLFCVYNYYIILTIGGDYITVVAIIQFYFFFHFFEDFVVTLTLDPCHPV